MALTGTEEREYRGCPMTLADLQTILTDTAGWPVDSEVYLRTDVENFVVKVVRAGA